MKTTLELDLILPDVPRTDDCRERLTDLLQGREGIQRAHIVDAEDEPTRLCVHFDPARHPVGEIRRLARQAGADLAERYGHLVLAGDPRPPRQARRLGRRLAREAGVLEAVVSPEGATRIEFDRRTTTDDAVRRAFDSLVGGELRRSAPTEPVRSGAPSDKEAPSDKKERASEHEHEHEHGHEHEEKRGDDHGGHDHGGPLGQWTELGFAVASGVLLLTGWLLAFLPGLTGWVPWGLYVAAYVFGGFFTVREAIGHLRVGRFEIDTLMLFAAAGAAALGEWAEGALLLVLFSLGHGLEHLAMARARRAIEALGQLTPETARVRRDGTVAEVSIDELVLGDVVQVRPHERVAADGFVLDGSSSVDQAPVTGESVPVEKRPVDDREVAAADPESLDPAHRVFAGTINQGGSLDVQVTRLASESTMARVIATVSEAETQQSPTQRFTDRFEAYFVPSVIVVVFVLLFAPFVIDEPFRDSFYRAMAVLVAASPCALAIATPSAVLSAVARAARGGVLVKGGGPLENLGRLTAIAFDKTGTLTEGTPRITDVAPLGGVDETELLRVVVAVEERSDHPLARAIARDGRERLGPVTVPTARDIQSLTGRGVQATLDGVTASVGNERMMEELDGPGTPEALRESAGRLKEAGRSVVLVRHGDRFLGVIGLMDTPRDAARATIESLRKLGVRRMIMISGDNQAVATAVAGEVGITEAWGDLLPADKVESIRRLRAEGGVAMVGDGVNDAPAMANATVGIAMGAAGSDVALETADVALMADDLRRLPFAVGLSRKTSRIIAQNLWISVGMVALLVPATVLGLNIGFAVLLHEGSTFVVVVNALRLLAYREPSPPPSE